jgi:uncharacterized repeat protein (TIGR03803 family)
MRMLHSLSLTAMRVSEVLGRSWRLAAAACMAVLPSLVAPSGALAKSAFTVVYNFTGGEPGVNEGADPSGALAYDKGRIYGTTYFGGNRGNTGTVYALTPSGQPVFVATLNNSTGYRPTWGVQQGGKVFYGAGEDGGARCGKSSCGKLFSVTAKGKVKKGYGFQGGADGSGPGSLPIDVNGTLYGVTVFGGAHNGGTFYSISPAGVHTVLYSFGNGTDAAGPIGLIAANGMFYGFTPEGGTYNAGAAYSITTSGAETVLYSFGATSTDATEPAAAALYANGVLYGTSDSGGTNQCISGNPLPGCGTIFTVSLTGTESVLYSFTNTYNANNAPGPLVALNGLLYGTAPEGLYDCGYLFSISPTGTFTDVHDFAKNKSEGCGPSGPLLDVSGTLYGTMGAGGTDDEGTMYSFTP